ncbi:MAG: AraC family transcriptional regulator [Bacteroidota bacterium]
MKAIYHDIHNSPGSSFRVKLFEGAAFPAAWHFHHQYELTYMFSSSGIRYVGDQIGTFQRGDLVLVGANLPHSWITVGRQQEQVRCIIIQWNDTFLGDWLDKPELQAIKKMLQSSARGLQFDTARAIGLEPALLQLNTAPPFERLLLLLKLLQQLATEVSRQPLAGTSFADTLTNAESERINQLYDFVEKNYLRPLTLQEVASHLSMGREAFCRYFKRAFNKSFFTFLNEYKINLARKLLLDTDLSVSEIAYTTGYQNLTFFHRQFRKFCGEAPGRYRRRYEFR